MPDHAIEASILVIYVKPKVMDFNSKGNEFYIVSTCSHLQKVHMTLSEKHTIKMDNAFNRASSSCHTGPTRTSKSRLYPYLSKINVADTDRCGYSLPTLVY